MGLFDIFKKKEQSFSTDNENKNEALLSDFRFYYLYGFTNNPNQSSADTAKFNQLHQLVVGPIGGVTITNSYHPYFIVNPKGLTVWAAAYLKLFMNDKKDEVFKNIIENNAVYAVDTSTVFTNMNVWPDTRLTYDDNPIFGRYVPFIIPFLVVNTDKQLNWDKEINVGIAAKGDASEYVEQVTNAISFFMPEPAFIVGFDEFNETNPSELIDKFIACKPMFGVQ